MSASLNLRGWLDDYYLLRSTRCIAISAQYGEWGIVKKSVIKHDCHQYVTWRKACEILAVGDRPISRVTLNRRRKTYTACGKWIKGLHWKETESREIVYNQFLLEDWQQNYSNPIAHQAAIEVVLKTLQGKTA